MEDAEKYAALFALCCFCVQKDLRGDMLVRNRVGVHNIGTGYFTVLSLAFFCQLFDFILKIKIAFECIKCLIQVFREQLHEKNY